MHQDLAPMPHELVASTQCVLFSDVVESTQMIDHHGEREWLQLLDRHARLVSAIATKHNGRVSNFLGDGFMVMFDEPSDAVACALRIQFASTVQGLLGTRVGVDHGDIYPYREGWWVGLAIHVAARLTEICEAGEVVMSQRSYEAAASTVSIPTGEQRLVQLRGMCEPSVIHVVEPGESDG